MKLKELQMKPLVNKNPIMIECATKGSETARSLPKSKENQLDGLMGYQIIKQQAKSPLPLK
ncbi:hypothetical protein HPP92_018357 [Vanilla planifolia]|uniref:Uncharacterized protein n=1 Tax=Vanilla planifolia TaxID=51239 RepID=A0A835UM67_VANPL|nr:hypothetical protein HPP92_018357 [Vanilla planifolia]